MEVRVIRQVRAGEAGCSESTEVGTGRFRSGPALRYTPFLGLSRDNLVLLWGVWEPREVRSQATYVGSSHAYPPPG
jgi:hypothetical protein